MKTRIMIYVEDVDMSVAFWTDEFGAQVVARQTLNGGYQNVIVGISSEVELSIFPRDYIRIYSPEVAENVPSLMFFSKDFDKLHDELLDAGEITEVNGVLTFNFTDPEGNYFVVAKDVE
ncbi:VOC family protein [Companilactobacillus huachuanensis]|uniref:VOC family protein n=1 Tax=Companilactobacillus huachuanensis TaxID=2559914 RepID=A0ABW1RH05_9LACO|nr:VOC family protein [Companilactobacillus huachuanensis]